MLKRTKPAGFASTYGLTTAWIVRLVDGVEGSFVSMVIAFAIGPAKFEVSTCAVTFPVCPGLITLSKSATVHPHDGRAAMIWRSASPVFFTTNDQSSLSPLGIVPKSLTGSTTVRRGAFSADLAVAALASLF